DSTVQGARGVIINVTGGPDMSLMEVNEASCIIQEAAHEDANIIFGAVIDPNLSGKLKITVIATGFQHVDSRRATPAAATATPTDLSSYSQLKVAEAAVQPVASASVLSVRRPSIELPLTRVGGIGFAPRTEAPATTGEGDELESPLDVPAFLRRQS